MFVCIIGLLYQHPNHGYVSWLVGPAVAPEVVDRKAGGDNVDETSGQTSGRMDPVELETGEVTMGVTMGPIAVLRSISEQLCS